MEIKMKHLIILCPHAAPENLHLKRAVETAGIIAEYVKEVTYSK